MKSAIIGLMSRLRDKRTPAVSSTLTRIRPERHRERVPTCSQAHDTAADEAWCEFLAAIQGPPSPVVAAGDEEPAPSTPPRTGQLP
jgi:hypothetical protein